MKQSNLTLDNIAYRFVYDHTAFFLGQLKKKNEEEFDMLIRRVKSRVPSVHEMRYIFDETIWPPDSPELYGDLIRFHVRLINSITVFSFSMLISKGTEQPNVEPLVPDNTVYMDS